MAGGPGFASLSRLYSINTVPYYCLYTVLIQVAPLHLPLVPCFFFVPLGDLAPGAVLSCSAAYSTAYSRNNIVHSYYRICCTAL